MLSRYWFKPTTWEGRVVVALFVGLIVWALYKYNDNPGYMFLQIVMLIVLLLVLIRQRSLPRV